MFGFLGNLANIDMEAVTAQALAFKEEIETRVRNIEETQARIEQKLDRIIDAGQTEG